MPITPSFTVQQILGYPAVVRVTDTSTGSDGAIAARRVYLYKFDGTTLVPPDISTPYIEWSYAAPVIDINVLDKDYALRIVLNWVNSVGTVLYTATSINGLTMYNESFDYQLTQQESGNPLLTNDTDFFQTKSRLRTEIDSGNTALEYQDLFGSQQCYDRATKIRTLYPYPI